MVAVLEIKIYSTMTNYQISGLILIVFGLWFAFEIYRAPMMDENTGKIIKPGKKLSDLWRKRS
jgi:hypothetical protein